MKTVLNSVAVGMAVVLCGCGAYTPAPVILPSHVKRIVVSPVQNKTPVYILEDDLQRRVIDEFMRDGRFEITNDTDADGAVAVTINRYILEPVAYDANNVIQEYRLWVLVDLRFIDQVRNSVLWEEPNLESRFRYLVETNSGGMTEQQARLAVWDELSRAIVKRTVEGFGSVSGVSGNKVPQNIPEE